MKNILFIALLLALLLVACGGNEEKNNSSVKLFLHPSKAESLKMEYSISVNNQSSGEKTSYKIEAEGSCDSLLDGSTEFLWKNTKISMEGFLFGKEVQAEAGNMENVSDTLKMVTTPVFNLHNKMFKSAYGPAFDRAYEVQFSDSGLVDSTENKIQFFLSYPVKEIKKGDSWEKELVIKAGNKMNCSAKYVLKEIKGDSLEIEMTGKLSGKGQSFGMEFSIDGKLDGHFWVWSKNGLPFDAEVKQEFTLDMNGKKSAMNYLVGYKVR